MVKISIIIATYNSIDFIKNCLDYLFNQTFQNFEVIVIDNGSKDGTVCFIKENYPQVILIENKENLGAAKARNQAIEIAKGEWILTLDCDVILEKNFLHKIISFAEKSRDSIGMIQPKVLNIDKRTVYSCGIYLSKLRRFYDIGKGIPAEGNFDKGRYIFGACSAAALYKRRMLEEIKEETGYFDERFFFLVEDVDLAWRAQSKGWKALYYPQTICYHYENSSSYNLEFRQYLSFRNRYLLMLKNETIGNLVIWLPFIVTYDIMRLFYLLFFNRYTLKALGEITPLVPKILERRMIAKSKIKFYF